MNTKGVISKINEANKTELLFMRKALFASFIKNLQKEESEGMYFVSLITLLEFERLARHLIEQEIIKN